MKKVIIFAIISLVILIFAFTSFNENIEANSDNQTYLEIVQIKTIDDFGTWKVDFSEPVKIDDNMYNNISIIEVNGNNVPIEIKYANYENTSILIKVKENKIETEIEYILSINQIESVNKNKLKTPFSKNFKLSRKPITILSLNKVNDYEWEAKFDQEVLIGSKTNENIKIYNSNKKLINKEIVYKDDNKDTLIIKINKDQLRINEEYTISISESINNKWDSILSNRTKEKFKVDKIEIDEELGLGKVETQRVSNDRDYEWYIDQLDTGDNYKNNGGLTTALMAAKWAIKDKEFTVDDARRLYYPGGDKWDIYTIEGYLNSNKIETKLIEELTITTLKKLIEDGNIAILNVDCKKIPFNSNDNNVVNRFDNTLKENFIVVKGYRVVDGKLYFEIYDPYSLGRKYKNGLVKGRDRYYSGESLISAYNALEGKGIIVMNSSK